MNRFVDERMRRFKHSYNFSFRDLFRKFAASGCRRGLSEIYKRRRKWINRCLFLLITVTIISACNSTSINSIQSSDSPTALSDCRIVQHELGEACIPLNPQRVVVLEGGLDTLLSLGMKPVGSTELGFSYLKDEIAGIASVGNRNNPNLESIVALKPDLILGVSNNNKNYKMLSQIAPTVLPKLEPGNGWKRFLNKYAEVLGKADQAEQILADYNARIEKFQAQMGDRIQQTEVSIVAVFPDRIMIYLEDTYCGAVVADAGFPRPDHHTEEFFGESGSVSISKEVLHKADGDVIFVWTGKADEEMTQESQTALRKLRADPLWSNLNAVQQDKVYEVPSRWVSVGPIAANLVLDDLFKYLVDSPSQTAQ